MRCSIKTTLRSRSWVNGDAMITGITIQNFKGIRDRVTLPLRPITLLFGANSAGKSTILHALQYLGEILSDRNIDPHNLGGTPDGIDLGGFHSFAHGKRSDEQVTLGVSFLLSEDGLPRFFTRTLPELDEPETLYTCPAEATVEVSIRWSEMLGHAYVARYGVEFDNESFAVIEFEPGTLVSEMSVNEQHSCLTRDVEHSWFGKWHPLEPDQLAEDESVLGQLMSWANHNYAINGIGPGRSPYTNILGVIDQKDALPRFTRSLRLDADWAWSERDPQLHNAQLPELADHLTEVLSQLVVGPGQLVRNLLLNSRFLGPIREIPARTRIPLREKARSNWATGLTAWERLESGTEQLVSEVNDWLSNTERLNSGFEITIKNFKELDLSDPLMIKLLTGRAFDEAEDDARLDIENLPTRTRLIVVPVNGPTDKPVELTPSDVGIGVSQVVPVIVAALDGEGWLVSIEQPELHVHPKLQAEIADLFVEATHVNRHQFIIETHSEHFILRLLRRIRETEKGTADANRQLRTDDLAVNYIRMEDGCSEVTQIDIDVKGEFIQPWPDDFFEIDFYERFH